MADGDTPDLSLIPEPLWQEAERRAAVLRPLADLPACSRDQARLAATALGVTERQVYRLLRKCREGGGTLTAMLRGGSSGGRGKARIAERRDTMIREAVSDLYLTPQRLSASSIVVEVRKRARAQHVRPPSAGTVRRRIAALSMEDRRQRGDVDVPEAVLGSTVTAQAPLDMVQIDHTPVDLILVDPIERRPIGRPWVTVAIDVFSRCIAGFHVTLEAPSSTSVGLCLAHVASDKRDWLEAIEIDADWPVMGRPRRIGVDNATEFHSEALERGCAQHDITIDWRPLGRPQVGGVVERVIGTLMELVHALPGTTFSNVMQRGRYDSDRAACLTLAELERWLAVAIAKLYHLRPHAGLDGEVPLRRYQEGVRALASEGRAPPTPRDPRAFLIDFLPVVRRTLRRDGVVIDHIHYYSDALKPWIERDGPPRRVLIRRDPRDLSRIYVHDPDDGGYLEVGYRELARPPVSLWEHRLARSRLRRQRQGEVDEGVLFAAIEEMREIETRARATTRTTRRNQARRLGLRVIAEPDPQLSEPASPWPMRAVDRTASSQPFDVEEW
jgi:putative transposase